MNKLAIIFNTCGISGEHPQQYVKALDSILEQEMPDSQIIVSACMNSRAAMEYVKKKVARPVTFNLIQEKLPVNVTFNHSALKARELFGDFEGYLYVDSGIEFTKKTDIFSLYKLLSTDNYGMVAAQVDTDGGYFQWFGIGDGHNDHTQNHKFFENGDFEIPIGKTVNLHCQIFSKEILDTYGYLFPDIYASFCSESVFSFLCAAIKKKFVLSKDVVVKHLKSMDGPSSGFSPHSWMMQGRPTYDHPFLVDSVVELARKGQEFGFGYEECQNIVNHNPDKYDGLFCNDDRLKNYIRDNQFVGNLGLLDYSKIEVDTI